MLVGAIVIQLKVEPVTLELSAILVCVPVQIVSGAGVALAIGNGFTVITYALFGPAQLFAVGVITYVTVPGTLPELVMICEGTSPDPLATKPVMFAVPVAVQL